MNQTPENNPLESINEDVNAPENHNVPNPEESSSSATVHDISAEVMPSAEPTPQESSENISIELTENTVEPITVNEPEPLAENDFPSTQSEVSPDESSLAIDLQNVSEKVDATITDDAEQINSEASNETDIDKHTSADDQENMSSAQPDEQPVELASLATMALPELHHDEIIEEEEIDNLPDIDYSKYSREELIIKLEELVKNPKISKIKKEITSIKVSYLLLLKAEKQAFLDDYIAKGGTKEEYIPEPDVLEERFKRAFDIYKTNKIKDDQEQERIKLDNLQQKKQILEELKALISSDESLKKTHDDFKALQEKWKQIGMVPRADMEGLWNNYHFLVEKFFEKVKMGKELKDLDLKKNLETKLQLCEKVEELLIEKSITKTFKLLQTYHDEWKEIGPVPLDKKDEIWERFKNVSDQINQHRKEYYDSLHSEQENNLLAKTALCEKVEEIISVEITTNTEWKEKTDAIIEMQKLWETIGRAPAKLNDEVWDKFRNAINIFFQNKKEFFGELKDQQVHNYNLKIDLCAQAEGMINTSNWKQGTNDILKLQQDWKQIGPVPKRHSDKIWKRFRAACDAFFAKKSEYYSNIQSIEAENQKRKQELIERVNAYEVMSDQKLNIENLKNFQREWTDIGFVPMNIKEKLQFDFKTAINKLMEKLQVTSNEINSMNYKSRIDNIQNSPDARNALYKERMFVETKLNKLKTEILQWENNLGFFAASKKADLLKEEFEKKIQSAKQEQALLEAKLKMLRNQA